MRRKILTGLCFGFVVLVMAGVSFSAIPKKISFQGRLLSSAGAAVPDGNYSITFKIYDASSGGVALWSETQTVATTSGYYNVVLGSTTAITLVFDKDYWISVQVGADLEMSPRFYLGVAGYCVNSDTLDGKDSTDFVLKAGDNISGNLNISGNVGIGTTAPTWANKLLHIYRTAADDATMRIQNTSPSGYAVVTYQNDVTEWHAGVGGGSTGSNYADKFYVTKSGWASPPFVVNNSGSVGIGTVSPETLLHISQSSAGTVALSTQARMVLESAGSFNSIQFQNPNVANAGLTWGDPENSEAGTLNYDHNTDTMSFGINGTAKMKINSTGNVLVGNPGTTTAKVSAFETGTANRAGYFEIDNTSNENPAVTGWTNGRSNAGYFVIALAANSSAAVFATTSGTGSLFQGNALGTGNLLQLQKSGVDKFAVDNAGIVGLPKNTAQPYACDAGHDGYVALTSGYRLCVCKGGTTTWVFTSDGVTSCAW